MKLSSAVVFAVASAEKKTWLTKEWEVQDAYFAKEDIVLHDPTTRSNKQWHDCGDKPALPANARSIECSGPYCAVVCPIGWRSQAKWRLKCQKDNTWSHHKFSKCITCDDMSDEIDALPDSVQVQNIFQKNLPVAQFFCGRSSDELDIFGRTYKKGGQKKNVKCLCKNGQNGDPMWKKSCSWSFQGQPWVPSDVNSVSCEDRSCLRKNLKKYPAPPGYSTPWSAIGPVYYKVHEGLHNIEEARALCAADAPYLTLPIPRNEAENDFWFTVAKRATQGYGISDTIKAPTADAWLGMSDIEKEGTWMGDDGKEVTWFKWRPNEPNNYEDPNGNREHWAELDLSGLTYMKLEVNCPNDSWHSSIMTNKYTAYRTDDNRTMYKSDNVDPNNHPWCFVQMGDKKNKVWHVRYGNHEQPYGGRLGCGGNLRPWTEGATMMPEDDNAGVFDTTENHLCFGDGTWTPENLGQCNQWGHKNCNFKINTDLPKTWNDYFFSANKDERLIFKNNNIAICTFKVPTEC